MPHLETGREQSAEEPERPGRRRQGTWRSGPADEEAEIDKIDGFEGPVDLAWRQADRCHQAQCNVPEDQQQRLAPPVREGRVRQVRAADTPGWTPTNCAASQEYCAVGTDKVLFAEN